MKVKATVKITNDKLPALRRELRAMGRQHPPADPHAELRAQAAAHAAAEGLDAADVLEHLMRIEGIRARLGPEATELDVASDLAAELGVTLEELLEASGLGPTAEVPT